MPLSKKIYFSWQIWMLAIVLLNPIYFKQKQTSIAAPWSVVNTKTHFFSGSKFFELYPLNYYYMPLTRPSSLQWVLCEVFFYTQIQCQRSIEYYSNIIEDEVHWFDTQWWRLLHVLVSPFSNCKSILMFELNLI